MDCDGDPSNGCESFGPGCPAVTLATNTGDGTELVADDQFLYWTDFTGGRVMRVELDGGTPRVLASGLSYPNAIRVDAQWVYFGGSTALNRMDHDGGNFQTLLPFATEVDGFAYDAIAAFSSGNQPYSTMESYDFGTGSVGVVESPVYGPYGYELDDTWVYWIDRNTGVHRVLRSGGTSETLSPVGGLRMQLVDDLIYFTHYDTNQPEPRGIYTVPRDGGATIGLYTGEAGPYTVIHDGPYVYWANTESPGPGEVCRGLLDGGRRDVLISGEPQPWGVTVDAVNVYWIDRSGQTLRRMHKPTP